jgi:hypothetical protein
MFILQAVVGAFVTFFFVTLLGNWVLQAWQQRSWLNQQWFLGKQAEYDALKELFDEIVSLAGRRITRMRRLQYVLSRSDDELVKKRREDYDKVQTEWNDKLNSFYVRLRLYGGPNYDMADRLEEQIQNKFVNIGSRLERAVRDRQEGALPTLQTVTSLNDDLNDLGGALIRYMGHMLLLIEKIKEETYFGAKVTLKPDTLELFPTWQLFIALFKRRIQPYRIVRTPIDLGEPKRSWD